MAQETHEVTLLLEAAQRGDSLATERLLPLVYEELRRMARAHLANEKAGQTLQPTALVHEAYLRLVGDGDVSWNSRAHFFGAAAQAMRRILVDRARTRSRQKRGGDRERVELLDDALSIEPDHDTMLCVDEILDRLEAFDKTKLQVVMLRYFAGLSNRQVAAALNMTEPQVQLEWTYCRAWIHAELEKAGARGGA